MMEADPSLHDYNKSDTDSVLVTSNILSSTNAPPNPFDRLPTELITRILFYVVEAPLHYPRMKKSDWDEPNAIDRPCLPCSVCRRWRSIAFSTPQLWEYINVRFKKPLEDGYECVLLKQWLERSGQNLISLKVGTLYECIEGNSYSPSPIDLQNIVHNMMWIISSVPHRPIREI